MFQYIQVAEEEGIGIKSQDLMVKIRYSLW